MQKTKIQTSTSILIALIAILFFALQAGAAPADPFSGSSPSFDAPPEEGTNYNNGDWGVSEQNGAATYTIPIDVPPGRNGMAPSLALRYSSNLPLHGGLAVGWSMHVPSIERDLSLGVVEGTHYKIDLGSVTGRLVEVPEASPYPDSTAYRVQFDSSNTRIFFSNSAILEPNIRGWAALTSDGIRHYFEQEVETAVEDVWHITKQVDSFGNTVNYNWDWIVDGDGELLGQKLINIEYTTNDAAGLVPHAKIEFDYAPLALCTGSDLPIGAAYRKGSNQVTGAQPLAAVKSYVRDRQGSDWRLSKQVDLSYQLRSAIFYDVGTELPDTPSSQFINCPQNLLRYLTQVDVTAYDAEGTATAVPPIKLSYNYRRNIGQSYSSPSENPMREITIDAPGYGQEGLSGTHLGGVQNSLLDIDNDGIRDRVSVTEDNKICMLVWHKGLLGGSFEAEAHTSALPTAVWYRDWREISDSVSIPFVDEREGCTLSGQIAYRTVASLEPGYHVWAKGVVSYHFMDYTGDGRLDLITNVWAASSCYWTYDPWAIPESNGVCAFGGGTQTVAGTPPPMLPEGQNLDRYIWRVYPGTGNPDQPFRDRPRITVRSPVPLPISSSDENLDQTPYTDYRVPALFDLDGDGFLDIIQTKDTIVTNCTNQLLLRGCNWTVYFGNGTGTFPETAAAYEWNVPTAILALDEWEEANCGGTFVRRRATVVDLLDINGDGLADLVARLNDNTMVSYRNTGTGFEANAQPLNNSTALEKVQTDCEFQFVSGVITDGERGYLRRLVDLDGDGLLDMVWFEGGSFSITNTSNVKAKFNMGDRFGETVNLLFDQEWASSKRLFSAEWQPQEEFVGSWHIDTDFTDVTGDGRADLVEWHGDTLTYISSPGLRPASDLLSKVTNGRGLEVTFSYTPSTNRDVVDWSDNNSPWPNSNSTMPYVSWVVKEITVSGGHDTPPITTQYQYKTPRYLSASAYTGYTERSQFAGFSQNTQTITYGEGASQQVYKEYAYTSLHGNLVGMQTYRDGQLHSAERKEWEVETLFNGRIYITLPSRTTSCITTTANMSVADCFAQEDQVHRIEKKWEYKAAGKLFVTEEQIEGAGNTAQEGDRRTTYFYNIRDGSLADPEDYRVRVSQTIDGVRGADGNYTTTNRLRTIFNGSTGLPESTHHYLDADTYAETTFTHDVDTGNLLSMQKPMQSAANGGSNTSTSYSYDSHHLFAYQTTNELGHVVKTTYDVATGVLIKREGPNAIEPVFHDFVLEATADTYVSERMPNSNFGDEPILYAGLEQSSSCTGNYCRMDSLLKFDTTPIMSKNIVAAELQLHVTGASGTQYPVILSIGQYAAHQVWDETEVNYSNYDNSALNGYCDNSIYPNDTESVWQCGQLVNWVQAWADGGTNNGLLLARRNSPRNAYPAFASRENDTAENRPKLIVTIAEGAALTVYDTERWIIDGFGRVLEHSISIDSEINGYPTYEERTIERFSYDDWAYYNLGQPVRIRTEQLQAFDGTHWIPTEQTLDGMGRVLSTQQLFNGVMTTHTSYTYDEQGRVHTIETPDPRNDDNRITFTYSYDSLGRVTHFARPNDTAISISYTGLSETISQGAPDGTGAAKTKRYDIFGRLVEVQEHSSDGSILTTHYQYDANNNVSQITDADGNITEMVHDWVGNRIRIIRGSRSWYYQYNFNGNLISEQSPVPEGADATQYTVTNSYDDLDRLLMTSFTEMRLSTPPSQSPTPSAFNVYLPLALQNVTSSTLPVTDQLTTNTAAQNITVVSYTYDEGFNSLGRLSQVDLPHGQVRYRYDVRGLATQEQRSVDLDDVATLNVTQQVNRTYNALGQLTESVWQDGQRWRIQYDERSLVDTVDWFDPPAADWQSVADYERDLSGLPLSRTSDYGQTRAFSYDMLARPLTDIVTLNNNPTPVSERLYTYTDSGDLASVTGQTNGVTADANYSYDAHHRLLTANGPNGYQGSFTYSATGNILSANVNWNNSPNGRNVRYNYGQHDPQAVDELLDLTTNDSYAIFDYDAAGNMIWRSTPDGETLFHWDGLDRLRRADTATGSETYYYDYEQQRMLAVNSESGVRFWFGEREFRYTLDGAELGNYLHLFGNGPTLARVENGTQIELQYADALQNLMFSLDASGNMVANFLYGPFGEVVYETGGENHRRQFNGKENDAVTGLRYYGYRYYEPLTMRWNTADPLYRFIPDLGLEEPQRMNLYTLSLNNPLTYYDPDGHNAYDKATLKRNINLLTKTLQGVHAAKKIAKASPAELGTIGKGLAKNRMATKRAADQASLIEHGFNAMNQSALNLRRAELELSGAYDAYYRQIYGETWRKQARAKYRQRAINIITRHIRHFARLNRLVEERMEELENHRDELLGDLAVAKSEGDEVWIMSLEEKLNAAEQEYEHLQKLSSAYRRMIARSQNELDRVAKIH